MNRIQYMFKSLRQQNKKGFFPFIVAGYPDLKTTEKLIIELEKSGADLIELGVPFSDPIADGPIIQDASYQALLKGVTLKKIFNLVERVREKVKIPIVLMSYYNPILRLGHARVAQLAKKSGVDGFIVPDLNIEASKKFYNVLDDHDLNLIYLISINSLPSRMKLIAKKSKGFIYVVSHLGITGSTNLKFNKIAKVVKDIRKQIDTPIGIGFGISTKEQAVKASKYGDAVIVGSAIIKIMQNNKGPKMLKAINNFSTTIKKVI